MSREIGPGTRLYSAPEFDNSEGPLLSTTERLERADIWSFGMVLWRVMIDGLDFRINQNHIIEDDSQMAVLRSEPTFGDAVANSCLLYLLRLHLSERTLAQQICKILRSTLDLDAFARPTSLQLLEELEELASVRSVLNLRSQATSRLTIQMISTQCSSQTQ